MACRCNSLNLNEGINSIDAQFALDDDHCGCGSRERGRNNSQCNENRGCEGIHCRCVSDISELSRETCCNLDGCCAEYPCRCRDKFWPEFAHPRWLSCDTLYSCNRN